MRDAAMNANDTLPACSALTELARDGDFTDCYSVPSRLEVDEALAPSLAFPPIVRHLMNLRNALVRPLGLQTEAAPGSATAGWFPIVSQNPREVVLGLDDRHLDFRLSMLSHEGRIYLASWVRPHNLMGRAYLALVMPFHIVLMRGAIRRAAG